MEACCKKYVHMQYVYIFTCTLYVYAYMYTCIHTVHACRLARVFADVCTYVSLYVCWHVFLVSSRERVYLCMYVHRRWLKVVCASCHKQWPLHTCCMYICSCTCHACILIRSWTRTDVKHCLHEYLLIWEMKRMHACMRIYHYIFYWISKYELARILLPQWPSSTISGYSWHLIRTPRCVPWHLWAESLIVYKAQDACQLQTWTSALAQKHVFHQKHYSPI